jgi:hypothetical protein
MSKSNALETDLLGLIFNNTALSWSSSAGFYIALHTADPGETGDQATNEVSYTGYARVLVARNSGGFTVSGNQVTNTAQIQMPLCTGGSATASHFSIGLLSTGAGQILYKGSLASPLNISNNITPQFGAATLTVQED